MIGFPIRSQALATAILLAVAVTAVLAIGIWSATPGDANDDQMFVAAYAQKLSDPLLYSRDSLLRTPETLRFYIPVWMAILHRAIDVCGDSITAYRLIASVLIFGTVLMWFLLLYGVTGSTLAAGIVVLGILPFRDLPYEIWSVHGLGYALPRSLANAIVPLLLLWTMRLDAPRRHWQHVAVGFAAGLLVTVHPPLAASFFPGILAVLVWTTGPGGRFATAAVSTAAFAAGASPYVWNYVMSIDTASFRDPAVRAAVASYYGFLEPLRWFSNPGLWKVWGFDWLAPAALAICGVVSGLRRTEFRATVQLLLVFACGATLYVALALAGGEILRAAGMPPAEPQAVRGLRHLALAVFSMGAIGFHRLAAGRRPMRVATLVLVCLFLWTPPEPVRAAWYARRHGPIGNAAAVSARRASLVRASEWADSSVPVDALFSMAGVTYDDAVLFRTLARRSVTSNHKDSFAFLHADGRRFLANARMLARIQRAQLDRSSEDIVRLALEEAADYLVVESWVLPWFRAPLPVRFTDGSTSIYALSRTR